MYKSDNKCIYLTQITEYAKSMIIENQQVMFLALYWYVRMLSVNAWKYKFSLLVAQLNKHKESPFQGSFSFNAPNSHSRRIP